ncbi:PAS domain S-box protein [Halorubrum tropicale]|uniref:PAS domain S-box protein n=1 Tax=Halorubrum tropicale TaxID=1765655 RepID=UPI0009E768BE|nr:PAS domain S-box protein [Halorubrum tropicale]
MSNYKPRNPLNNTVPGNYSRASRVLLLLQNDTNRDHLAAWLSGEYEIVTPEDKALSQIEFDLCILDTATLEHQNECIHSLKETAEPTFLPFLLVAPERTDRSREANIWEIVDEVISVPAEKQTLKNRLCNLLERRRLSQQQATALTQQRELFQRIFESSNDAIVLIDPQRNTICECNSQACDLLGYTREDLLQMSPEDVHPDEVSEFRAFRNSVLDKGHDWTAELTCRTGTGRLLDVETSASTVEIGGRTHMLASIRDVTTRTGQQKVMNNLHDVTIEFMEATTKQEVATVIMEAARGVFGYDIASVRLHDAETKPETLRLVAATPIAESYLDTTATESEFGDGVVGEAFATGEPVVVNDLQARTTPFNYGSIRSAMFVPLGSHGILSIGATEIGAFDETNVEVTQVLATNATAAMTRAQREQTLHEQTESLRGLFENATDCIVDIESINEEPRIRDVNPRFEEVFGYNRSDIQGESLSELVVPSDTEAESKWLIKQSLSGERVEIEARRETATGRRDFFIRAIPVQRDGAEYGAYVVYTDITERKRRDQQLQVLNRVLRHNIRNKLNIVHGVLDRSVRKEKNIPEQLAEEGLTATNELLDLSQTAREFATETRAESTDTPISVTDCIPAAIDSLEQDYPDAKLSTDVTADKMVPGTARLYRVLRELCENAIVHCHQAIPEVEVSCEQSPKRDDWVMITVTDNGPGIPDDQQAILENGEETDLKHSNGLGLWTVQWITTITGGDLTINTQDRIGTTVTIYLPTVQPDS